MSSQTECDRSHRAHWPVNAYPAIITLYEPEGGSIRILGTRADGKGIRIAEDDGAGEIDAVISAPTLVVNGLGSTQ